MNGLDQVEAMENIMNRKLHAVVVVGMGSILLPDAAHAQMRDEVSDMAGEGRALAPAIHAVELTIGTGYEQAFGKIASKQPSLTDIGSAGGGLQLGVGYRVLPQLALGLYGTGADFSRSDTVDASSKIYSASAGVQADWHLLPASHEFDPWISFGTGWRGYWVDASQGTTSTQGMQLVKLQVGLDYRVAQSVSVSPVIGADLSAFFTQSTPSEASFKSVSDPNVNTFVFAGVMGRFDIPTQRDASRVATDK